MPTATDQINDFIEYRESIQFELDRRISEYQNGIAAEAERLRTGEITEDERPPHIIAIGDSWFDFPLCTDIMRLLIANWPDPKPLSLAHFGQTSGGILGLARKSKLIEQLQNKKNGKFDAILISAGGNDLAGDPFRIWLKSFSENARIEADAINPEHVKSIIAVVRAAYEDLIEIRDNAARDGLTDGKIPIFAHSYDFAIPSGIPAIETIAGPWLLPGLVDRGWTRDNVEKKQIDRRKIIKLLLEEFAKMLDSIEDPEPDPTKKSFIHIKTQGTLFDNKGNWDSGMWHDEMHPTKEGFKKIVRKFVEAIFVRFPKRSQLSSLLANEDLL